jgi:hypothetical protein
MVLLPEARSVVNKHGKMPRIMCRQLNPFFPLRNINDDHRKFRN